MEVTGVLVRTSGSLLTTAFTYALERPLRTRHTGRSKSESRWWFCQKRTRLTTGHASASSSEQLQMAAHLRAWAREMGLARGRGSGRAGEGAGARARARGRERARAYIGTT